ncbi:FecR family protein [Pseudoalteromonas tunicata]|uniref:FecR family protein n=1 Tax=Pseudoalteromonas tunicata TaxID=314281 RepID=UPI00273E2BBF|nr:FecR domain-containing protein [Pseudoalteromonas tunicata]MDP4984491.1 FecR domain-containing protein [Pseudoalteromonas tunicata]
MNKITIPERNRIADEAANWLLILDEDNSKQTQQAFQVWLEQDAHHQQAFSKLQIMWGLAVDLPTDCLTELPQPTTRTWWQTLRHTIKNRLALTPLIWPVGSAAFALLVATFSFIAINQPQQIDNTLTTQIVAIEDPVIYQTPTASHQSWLLADGSQITLGADSKISVVFKPKKRAIELLQGIAVFKVAKDPKRPFVVSHHGHSATAIGTEFVVKAHLSHVSVAVLEGKVAVMAANNPNGLTLELGEQAELDQHSPLTKQPYNLQQELEWQSPLLEYHDVPLGEVLHDIRRFTTLNIYLADNDIAAYKYSGQIHHDKVEQWLSALPHLYQINLVKVDNTRILQKQEMQK